jgi:hypothetical protein
MFKKTANFALGTVSMPPSLAMGLRVLLYFLAGVGFCAGAPLSATAAADDDQEETTIRVAPKLAGRGVHTVEVLPLDWPFPNKYKPEPGFVTPVPASRKFRGETAQKLVELWDAQQVDCQAPMLMCFAPSYALRFYNEQGMVMQAKLCWGCGQIGIQIRGAGKICGWQSPVSMAREVQQQLWTLVPPMTNPRPESGIPSKEIRKTAPAANVPVRLGAVQTDSRDATLHLQRQLTDRRRDLAYCFQSPWTPNMKLTWHRIVEFDLAPYTLSQKARELAGELPMSDEERIYQERGNAPGQWLGLRQPANLRIVGAVPESAALDECITMLMQRWLVQRLPSADEKTLHVRVPFELGPAEQHRSAPPAAVRKALQ